MSNTFTPPADIEGTVSEIMSLKAGVRTAIGGTRVLAPHVANQVAALYELAGVDEATADTMADGIRTRGNAIEELLEQVRNELAAIGGIVATAVRAHDESEAKRKVTASKAGTKTTTSRATSGTMSI